MSNIFTQIFIICYRHLSSVVDIMPDGDKCHGKEKKKKLVKQQRITVGGGGVCYYRQNSI